MATAVSASSSLQAAALVNNLQTRTSLKPTSVSRAFGLRNNASRLTCSMEDNVRSFVEKCADAGKTAAVALAAAALIAQPAMANPGRLTYDDILSKTYQEIKGSGQANQCPEINLDGAADGLALKSGKYSIKKFCMEPTSFTVKAASQFKSGEEEYQKTKLMTRLTYTLDEMEGTLDVGGDGSVKLVETDGIDYAAVTVQLPGGERVPFLFTVKELVATGKADAFSGKYLVPSYRGASFLDPKGRGATTGYDSAVALPAGGFGDQDKLGKENDKNVAALEGEITFSLAKTNARTAEIGGTFLSVQPSDTDLGAKAPKDVKIEGYWYAQYN